MTLRPAPHLVIIAGLALVAFWVVATIGVIRAERPIWQPTFGVTMILISVATLLNFLNGFFVTVREGELVQSRIFKLWNRRVAIDRISMVSLDTIDNFMNATIVRLQIKWPGNTIQLTSSMYRERDLLELIETLRRARVPLDSRVQAWVNS